MICVNALYWPARSITNFATSLSSECLSNNITKRAKRESSGPSLSTSDENRPILRWCGTCSNAATKLSSSSDEPARGPPFCLRKAKIRGGMTDSIVYERSISRWYDLAETQTNLVNNMSRILVSLSQDGRAHKGEDRHNAMYDNFRNDTGQSRH